MRMFIASLIIWLMIFAALASAEPVNYTNRKNMDHTCELFAKDVYQAAYQFKQGMSLRDLLVVIENAPVTDSHKDRIFEAIQLVWKNQMDNPILASTVAMGLCLKPKRAMAPLDDAWAVSPRTIGDAL